MIGNSENSSNRTGGLSFFLGIGRRTVLCRRRASYAGNKWTNCLIYLVHSQNYNTQLAEVSLGDRLIWTWGTWYAHRMEIQINPEETHETGEYWESAKTTPWCFCDYWISRWKEFVVFTSRSQSKIILIKIEPAILLLKDLTSTWGAELFDDNVGMLDRFLLILRYGQVGKHTTGEGFISTKKA